MNLNLDLLSKSIPYFTGLFPIQSITPAPNDAVDVVMVIPHNP